MVGAVASADLPDRGISHFLHGLYFFDEYERLPLVYL